MGSVQHLGTRYKVMYLSGKRSTQAIRRKANTSRGPTSSSSVRRSGRNFFQVDDYTSGRLSKLLIKASYEDCRYSRGTVMRKATTNHKTTSPKERNTETSSTYQFVGSQSSSTKLRWERTRETATQTDM